MITVQTQREGPILVTAKFLTGKLMKCSAARGFQDVKRNVLFHVIAANCIREKVVVSKNQVDATAEEVL